MGGSRSRGDHLPLLWRATDARITALQAQLADHRGQKKKEKQYQRKGLGVSSLGRRR